MILKEMIEKSFETFEKENYCFLQWYRSYRLAVYCLDNNKLNKNSEKELLRNLKAYYWLTLSQATLLISQKKDESLFSFSRRLRLLYHKIRQSYFSRLVKYASLHSNIIFKVLSIASQQQNANYRIKLDTPLTWLVRDPYE